MSEIPPELADEMTPAVRAFVESLLRRIADLEARLGMTPQNSSLPPSSQHPHAKLAPPKVKSKRKRGGQPGHQKHERALVPPEQVDETVVIKPTACRRCGQRLVGTDPEPWRHQVWELPEIKPTITEYQRHRLSCPCCGTSTCAELPSGVPEHQSGPRLTAFTGLLMGCFRQSKRRVALFCESVLNIPCSTGTVLLHATRRHLVVKLQNRATEALRPVDDELARALPRQKVRGIDESPTKPANHKAWLWTFVAEDFTVFRVRASRNAEILDALLSENFQGTVTCDRAKMSFRLPLHLPTALRTADARQPCSVAGAGHI